MTKKTEKTIKCQTPNCNEIAQNGQNSYREVLRTRTPDKKDQSTTVFETTDHQRKFYCGLHFTPGTVIMCDGSTYRTPSSPITPEDIQVYGE